MSDKARSSHLLSGVLLCFGKDALGCSIRLGSLQV